MALEFTEDGNRLIALSDREIQVRIWNFEHSISVLSSFTKHKTEPRSLLLTPKPLYDTSVASAYDRFEIKSADEGWTLTE